MAGRFMAHPKADYTKSTVKIINKKIRKPFQSFKTAFYSGMGRDGREA